MIRETPSNANLVAEIFEAGWNREEYEFLERVAPVVPFHYNGTTTQVTPESLPGLVSAWRQAFPDLKMNIRHLISQDDLVALSLTFSGTHMGEWMGIEATGFPVLVEEMMFFRFEDGVLVEMWEVFDDEGLRRQLSA